MSLEVRVHCPKPPPAPSEAPFKLEGALASWADVDYRGFCCTVRESSDGEVTIVFEGRGEQEDFEDVTELALWLAEQTGGSVDD